MSHLRKCALFATGMHKYHTPIVLHKYHTHPHAHTHTRARTHTRTPGRIRLGAHTRAFRYPKQKLKEQNINESLT